MSTSDITQLKTDLSGLSKLIPDITKDIKNVTIDGNSLTLSGKTKFTGPVVFRECPTMSDKSIAATRSYVITKSNTLEQTINNTLGLDRKATTVNLATGSSMTSFNIHTNTHITGDLTVSGTKTSVETTNTVFKDNLVGLNNALASTDQPTKDCGLIINRGSAGNAFIGFDESHDRFVVGTTQESADTTETNLTVTPGTLNVGNLLLKETPITESNKVLGSAVQLNNLSGIKDNFGLMLDLVTDGGLEITTNNKLQIKEAGVTNGMLATITEIGKVAGSAVQLNVGGGFKNDNGLMIDDGAITSSRLALGAIDLSSDRVTGVLPVANGGTGVTTNSDLLTSLGITQGFKAFAIACNGVSEHSSTIFNFERYDIAGETARLADSTSTDAAHSFFKAGDKYIAYIISEYTLGTTSFNSKRTTFENYITRARTDSGANYTQEQYSQGILFFDYTLTPLYENIISKYQKAITSYTNAAQLFTGNDYAAAKYSAERKIATAQSQITVYDGLMKSPDGTLYAMYLEAKTSTGQ